MLQPPSRRSPLHRPKGGSKRRSSPAGSSSPSTPNLAKGRGPFKVHFAPGPLGASFVLIVRLLCLPSSSIAAFPPLAHRQA